MTEENLAISAFVYDQVLDERNEAIRLIRLMHDPISNGEYCACGVCDFLARFHNVR